MQGFTVGKSLMLSLLLLLVSPAANAAAVEPTALHQEVDFTAPPARVYAALLDQAQFSRLTGVPGKIERGEGGTFSLFGGAIVGRTIELVDGRRIVQAWRDSGWAPGVYSLVKFELTPRGGGTHLVLDQTGYPQGEFHSLSIGWPAHYWQPMKKFFR
jgi:activator of HSP90 ATPase